jgi:hypothetical protein
VGPVDPQAARAAFLDAIGAGVGPERVMGLTWHGAGLPGVERRPPLATGSGKILHLHVGGQSGGSRERSANQSTNPGPRGRGSLSA